MIEKLVGVVPLVRKQKSFGRMDTYTLILTDSRMVFAQLTNDMMKQAAAEAQRKGKADKETLTAEILLETLMQTYPTSESAQKAQAKYQEIKTENSR